MGADKISVKDTSRAPALEADGLNKYRVDATTAQAMKVAEGSPRRADSLPANFAIDEGGSGKPLTPGDHHYTFSDQGKSRQYEIHVPSDYDGSKPIPVMYMMPGVGGSIEQMKGETGMNRVADAKGFAVVYVEALPKNVPYTFGMASANSWNLDGGSLTDKVAGYDDRGYMNSVDRSVAEKLNVDKNAQYVVGFSEGGGAAQYIAVANPGRFAGVGSVHGTRLDGDQKPQNRDKTAFIAIHGDDEYMLPPDGGKGLMTILYDKVTGSKPLDQKKVWAEADSCAAPMSADSKESKVTEYSCGSVNVKEIIRHGGQHAWDGLGQNGKGEHGWYIVGMPDKTKDTSSDVANFLLKYRKDDGSLDIKRNP
jgi:polyhydroxybutyrate depolymerase